LVIGHSLFAFVLAGDEMRTNPAKQALKAGRPSVGTWLTLGSILAARLMARAGFAWLTVDLEHSLVDWETATHMFGAIADAGCTALARVPANRHDHIKRALDNGAHGIVVPMVNSREEALAAVAAAKYPPAGNRSVGGTSNLLNFAATAKDYYARANDEILVVLQCEHLQAVNEADNIFSVPGIDAIFVGPNDLAASMRTADGRPASAEETARVMERIYNACRKHNVATGLHCMSADEAVQRIKEGWQFIAVESELKMMLNGATEAIRKLGLDRDMRELAKY
jgi:4-hydroxy-2-oxoheptanedioate aldolase